MRKLDENFSYILCKLNNVQRTLSAYSQSIVADPVPLDVDSSDDDKGDPALSFGESTLFFDDLVASNSERLLMIAFKPRFKNVFSTTSHLV
uniref:Uncharacterized protein n=1 Tax=Solanum tuberosum TaxID=4113 RepID=M1CGG3_SOLTU